MAIYQPLLSRRRLSSASPFASLRASLCAWPVAHRWLGALAILAGTVSATSSAEAQHRKYLFEVSAGGAANSFDNATDLGNAAGGVVRLGIWLPLHFSVEGEAAFSKPKAEAAGIGVNVRTLGASALYNIPVGGASSIYLKAGAGNTTYGGDCPAVSTPGSTICGSSGALLLGGGVRVGVTSAVMIRGEGLYNRNSSNSINLSNYGVNLGLSVMLGSRPIPDSDHDGVLDNRDACQGSPAGAVVDARGCTVDSDGDSVPNGVDRCPNTPNGATVDALGCPKDSDNDNILDGLDRCPDTRPGVLVDRQGCPRDSDSDGIPDGLDRCSDTPAGATVDALGCPGDEDGDGVLDGLDQCPRSPAGAVDANGCAASQQRNRPDTPPPAPTPAPVPPPVPTPAPVPTPKPEPKPAPTPPASKSISSSPTVLAHVTFVEGTARLNSTSYSELDSIATILLADTTVHVEIGAHSDNSGSPAERARLTTQQAEAVRTFLAQKGVSADQVVARGYGASSPLSSDNTPQGQARNRRIEIRRIPAEP